jgi:protein gp37
MADRKRRGGIAWTDETFNPVRGCRKLSAGCKNCYAASLSKINPDVHGVWGADGTRVFSAPGWESQFYAWEKKAAKAGKPMRIFVNSMWDPGEGPDLDGKEGRDGPRPEYLPVLARLVEIARRCPHLRLQMLTKRPWNLVAWWQDSDLGDWPVNLWVGASTEDQATADERIPWLMMLPAAVRFLSVEPMLGEVDLSALPFRINDLGRDDTLILPARTGEFPWVYAHEENDNDGERLAWVIAGCESGRGARPMDLAWVRALRDQCAAAGVPFFFKQAMEGREVVSLPTLDGKVWDRFPAEVTP